MAKPSKQSERAAISSKKGTIMPDRLSKAIITRVRKEEKRGAARQQFQNLLSMTWMLHFSVGRQVVDFALGQIVGHHSHFFEVNLKICIWAAAGIFHVIFKKKLQQRKVCNVNICTYLSKVVACLCLLHFFIALCLNMCKCNFKKNFQIAKLFS